MPEPDGPATQLAPAGNPALSPSSTTFPSRRRVTRSRSKSTARLSRGAGTYRTSISSLNGKAMGLMVDPADNTLYATTYTFDSNLYRVDPATGVATAVGPVGIPYPHGGDFVLSAVARRRRRALAASRT